MLTLIKVIETVLPTGKIIKARALYKCECGNEIQSLIREVNLGIRKSCGCILRKGLANKTHGLKKHKLYESWCRMKSRCYNHKNNKYYRYGARGVTVCDEWLNDFKAYYDWAIENGWVEGLQIDKDIKGNGLLYSPDTCIVVTNKQNCNKRSHTKLVTRNGETKSVMQWCEYYGINQSTVYSRINTGWSFEKALVTPKLNSNTKYLNRQ